MRKLIAGMQTSIDGKIEGPDGYADWVEAWSDHYDVMDRVDACLLGAGMYPGYEAYWSAIQTAPHEKHQPSPTPYHAMPHFTERCKAGSVLAARASTCSAM